MIKMLESIRKKMCKNCIREYFGMCARGKKSFHPFCSSMIDIRNDVELYNMKNELIEFSILPYNESGEERTQKMDELQHKLDAYAKKISELKDLE